MYNLYMYIFIFICMIGGNIRMLWLFYLLKSLKWNFLLILKNLNNLNLRVVLGILNLIYVFKIVFWVLKVFFIDKFIYIILYWNKLFKKKIIDINNRLIRR